MSIDISLLGKPDLKVHGFQIWVHGRQFPAASDYWDGNWLRITAHCGSGGASVSASGPILHLSEIKRWGNATQKLILELEGTAKLNCIEPNLSVELTAAPLGHVKMDVSITEDHLTQQHKFSFDIDQTFLPPLAKACTDILEAYPIKGGDEEIPTDLR